MLTDPPDVDDSKDVSNVFDMEKYRKAIAAQDVDLDVFYTGLDMGTDLVAAVGKVDGRIEVWRGIISAIIHALSAEYEQDWKRVETEVLNLVQECYEGEERAPE